MTCPNCARQDRQVKAGMTGGMQRYKCMHCGRRYSLDTRPHAYTASMRERAAQMHAAGTSIRQIARDLGISRQTVCNWVRSQPATSEPAAPAPTTPGPPIRTRNTIADVARHAGVSTSTVSNYLNDKGRMSLETRHRIDDAMKALYFTPNALVRSIRNRRTHTIGLVSYGITDLENVDYSIVPPVLSAINEAADQAGYDVLLYTGWPRKRRSRTGSDFLNGQIDGLIWMSPQPQDSQLRFAAAGGLPVIAMLARRVPNGVGYVVCDNIAASRDIVHHLVGLGHKRIAFLGSTDTSDYLDRAAGYREGLAAAGIPHNPELESTAGYLQWSSESVETVIADWLRMSDRPTAIVAISDGLAAQAIETIRRSGLRVPEDIAVTGFDDIPAAAGMQGGITTVHQPFREIGKLAVERLDAMINGAPLAQCRITLPMKLVIRSSTQT